MKRCSSSNIITALQYHPLLWLLHEHLRAFCFRGPPEVEYINLVGENRRASSDSQRFHPSHTTPTFLHSPTLIFKMQTFSRLLSVVTLVLSFGFLAHALPISPSGSALAARQYGSPESYGNDNNHYGGSSYGGSEYGNVGEYGSQAGNQIDVLALLTELKAQVDPHVTLLGEFLLMIIASSV